VRIAHFVRTHKAAFADWIWGKDIAFRYNYSFRSLNEMANLFLLSKALDLRVQVLQKRIVKLPKCARSCRNDQPSLLTDMYEQEHTRFEFWDVIRVCFAEVNDGSGQSIAWVESIQES